MRPSSLTRFLFALLVCASICAAAGDALAQTQQLNRTLERKFPSDYCPLKTSLIGTFVTDTGHIRLTFSANNGYDDGGGFRFFDQKLDDITIMEAAEFVAPNIQDNDRFCYTDEIVPEIAPGYDRISNPKVPFFEPFSPSLSECSWDESNGASIDAGGGFLALGSAALGEATVSTNVVISGLTPGVAYVIYGEWSANEFIDFSNCAPGSICLQIIVDDLTNGCGPLPTESTTWGAVKALYRN